MGSLSAVARYQHGPDPWALVTGASDGIGKAFALSLCDIGFGVILHGRNSGKLERVAAEIRLSNPTARTRLWIADAGAATFSETDLQAAVQDVRLTMLINNVGGTAALSQNFATFESQSGAELDALIYINCRFAVQLTRILLPRLARNGPALVMNIGSNAYLGAPYLAVYSGTKGFIMSWSRALSAELKGQGSRVVALGVLVGSTQSQQNEAPVSFLCPSSRTLARGALSQVGTGKAVVTAYWPHALQMMVMQVMPEWLAQKVTIDTMKPLAEGKQKTW